MNIKKTLLLTVMAGVFLVVNAFATVTIYRNDNTWVEGDEVKIETVFGRKFYLLRKGTEVIRIAVSDVFKVYESDKEETEIRAKFHFERGIKAENNGYLDVAMKEYKKALALKDDFVKARNRLVNIKVKIGSALKSQEEERRKMLRRNFTLDEVQVILNLRDDQKEFLQWVSEAHKIDYRKLISLALDNWIKDYKDYKLASEEEMANLPELRHPLLPE